MDYIQEYYDLIFQYPDTINGLRNKLNWLLKEYRDKSNIHLVILKNEIKETYELLRYIREDIKINYDINLF